MTVRSEGFGSPPDRVDPPASGTPACDRCERLGKALDDAVRIGVSGIKVLTFDQRNAGAEAIIASLEDLVEERR